jgi:hypothetical protein
MRQLREYDLPYKLLHTSLFHPIYIVTRHQ